MVRKKVSAGRERRLLTAMVVNPAFLARVVANGVDSSLFEARFARQLVTWCCEHYGKYKTAPGKSLEAIFVEWEATQPEGDEVDAMRDFLESLSNEYDAAPAPNLEHLCDQYSRYMGERSLKRLRDNIDLYLGQNNQEEAWQAVSNCRRTPANEVVGFSPLNGPETLAKTYAKLPEVLIEFPQEAGRFLNKGFVRGGFVAIQAPPKRGKTWMALELVYRAEMCRRRVAFFSTGDLTEPELGVRLDQRLAELPTGSRDEELWYNYPTGIEVAFEDGESPDIKVAAERKKAPYFIHDLRARPEILKSHQRFCRRARVDADQNLRIAAFPKKTLSVAGLEATLDQWGDQFNFVPEIVIIDMAEDLADGDKWKDYRHQDNENWLAMRRLSQKRDVLVITTTWSNAKSWELKTQRMGNSVSENNRKPGHVTALLGINQNDEEKKLGVMRLNWLTARNFPYDERQCLYCAQCLPLGKAIVKATLGNSRKEN